MTLPTGEQFALETSTSSGEIRATITAVAAGIRSLSINGIDLVHGVTNANLPEAAVKALMLRAAARTIVVADASKLGEVHLGRIAPIDAFDVLVTDAAAPHALVAELEQSGLTVLAARDSRVDP